MAGAGRWNCVKLAEAIDWALPKTQGLALTSAFDAEVRAARACTEVQRLSPESSDACDCLSLLCPWTLFRVPEQRGVEPLVRVGTIVVRV
jgi:hypothetical protein